MNQASDHCHYGYQQESIFCDFVPPVIIVDYSWQYLDLVVHTNLHYDTYVPYFKFYVTFDTYLSEVYNVVNWMSTGSGDVKQEGQLCTIKSKTNDPYSHVI